MLDTWRRDFTHGARSLARAPGFSLIVVATRTSTNYPRRLV
jgi:hypothetical protein